MHNRNSYSPLHVMRGGTNSKGHNSRGMISEGANNNIRARTISTWCMGMLATQSLPPLEDLAPIYCRGVVLIRTLWGPHIFDGVLAR